MRQILFEMSRFLVTLAFCSIIFPVSIKAEENVHISIQPVKGGFSLTNCSIIDDESDFFVVKKTASLFAVDIESATGIKPIVSNHISNLKGRIILLGTLGHNKLIDQLVNNGKLNISDIKGGWEQFKIQRINNPFKGVQQALIIVGSDRRGTAYGALSISEAIGVSPWSWWADVPIKKHARVYVTSNVTSKTPSVRYRGIFINDEDWGLKPWSTSNYEKKLGDIGPKTYARVCELILRLKGNMLAPAMHSCTGAFYSHPESKVVADQYGIIITTSHCEPLLFNNAAKSEWDSKRDGEWDYKTNRKTILKKMDNRVKEASPYENIYTIAMRGVHDEGMRGGLSNEEKVKVLTQVMFDQRNILQKYLDKPANEIPQIFVPYKEVLDVYELGLKVPEDATLVWPDDNYGYIKRLSNPEEQKRSGRAGVYYHLSYLGVPHDYLWLNTTPPVLMYEELHKAYVTGADRYWLLNVGDIKPAELGIQTFFSMAWDINKYNMSNINKMQSNYLSSIFGMKYEKDFQDLLDTYYRLAWSRKPEFMGWEYEWDSDENVKLKDTDFSFENYNDAQQRLTDYCRISNKANQIMKILPESYRPAFYEMIAYSIMGSYQMNRKFLMAQLNHELAKKNNISTNWAASEAQAAYDSLNNLSAHYNNMLNGKWKGMMALPSGFCAKYQEMPNVVRMESSGLHPYNLVPEKAKNKLIDCTVINLKKYVNKFTTQDRTINVVEGLGYDWNAIQLGKSEETPVDPKKPNAPRIDYTFSGVDADKVTVYVYALPFFPLYDGKGTCYGISVDGAPVQVTQTTAKEWTPLWKNQVIKNGAVFKATFSIIKTPKHIFSLVYGDPGVIIERVVIDWGGLKTTYVGPSVQ
jgi:hypothetical protein